MCTMHCHSTLQSCHITTCARPNCIAALAWCTKMPCLAALCMHSVPSGARCSKLCVSHDADRLHESQSTYIATSLGETPLTIANTKGVTSDSIDQPLFSLPIQPHTCLLVTDSVVIAYTHAWCLEGGYLYIST
jgi:hypothetical protein